MACRGSGVRVPSAPPISSTTHGRSRDLAPRSIHAVTATSGTATKLPSRTVTSTDGVRLAVYESGTRDRPTVLLMHGYHDDHTVWDRVASLLADRFRVVTYDMRGAGRSDRPSATRAYRIPQLNDDLLTVLET